MKTPHILQVGSWVFSSLLGGAVLGACASSGTEPHAMTAGQHQAAAESEEQAAARHRARYNRSAAETPKGPGPGAYAACISYASSNCYVRWNSEENPTDQHRKDAEHHRKLAENHRAASKALVAAEQRFCSGIPDADRDLSPFHHREDITAVQGIEAGVEAGDVYAGRGIRIVDIQQIEKEVLGGGGLQGARVTFRAVPGMTREWLQRVADCHLARNALIGDEAAMSFCPLAVPHATATVASTGRGFAVDVTSDDAASVREIIKRASALTPGDPTASR